MPRQRAVPRARISKWPAVCAPATRRIAPAGRHAQPPCQGCSAGAQLARTVWAALQCALALIVIAAALAAAPPVSPASPARRRSGPASEVPAGIWLQCSSHRSGALPLRAGLPGRHPRAGPPSRPLPTPWPLPGPWPAWSRARPAEMLPELRGPFMGSPEPPLCPPLLLPVASCLARGSCFRKSGAKKCCPIYTRWLSGSGHQLLKFAGPWPSQCMHG